MVTAAVRESDKIIREVVKDALKNEASNVLIQMGEGHLRSLINTGPLKEYTEKLLDRVKTDPVYVTKALEMSGK